MIAAASSANAIDAPPISATLIPTAAASEVIASLRWCQASASTTELCIDAPSRDTNRNNPSFTATTPTNASSVNARGRSRGSVKWTADFATIPIAASSIRIATTADAKGSAFPWP